LEALGRLSSAVAAGRGLLPKTKKKEEEKEKRVTTQR